MSKFWFFDRKGRPTTNEKKLCDTFNDLIDKGIVSNNQVEEYVEQYSKPMNEDELEEMFGFLTGEDSKGNKYQYADEGSNDYDDVDEYDESEVVEETPSSRGNSVDFDPFSEPVIERAYTKGFQPKSQDDDSDSEDGDEEGFSDDELKMPVEGDSIDDAEEDEDIPEPEWASGFGGSDSEEEEDEDYDDEDNHMDGYN